MVLKECPEDTRKHFSYFFLYITQEYVDYDLVDGRNIPCFGPVNEYVVQRSMNPALYPNRFAHS